MADTRKDTNGPSPYGTEDAHDPHHLPDFDVEFVNDNELDEFARALIAPESIPVTALNDWRPVHQRVRRKLTRSKKKKAAKRSKDETREGIFYTIFKWPLLLIILGWIIFLGAAYLVTRLYIWAYEHTVTWRGHREHLRQDLRQKTNYADWINTAKALDAHLGNEQWKETDDYAYYDSATIRRVREQLKIRREQAGRYLSGQARSNEDGKTPEEAVEELKSLVEACVKNNFAGTENPRIYSESYCGTKVLVQSFVDELERSLDFLLKTPLLSDSEKFVMVKHLHTNFGRTALCLSGGASFAYYHFGVVKGLLDSALLPDVITGTSGGALVAAMVATRTSDELKKLLVPALSHRINACEEAPSVWLRRWWKTGARFDSLDWARKASWFCTGMTFAEAYQKTHRVLNITCIPSDPYSPTILANYLTAPNCVIWSAVLASAAVPGILNPVVLMMKTKNGTLAPFSFGNRFKDGSLRTDVPLKSLNLHFNVTFSIVSQVNPHINLFFFSSRGTVGRPVTHRRGRGWRGGFLGSALEQYLKLDLTKWLKVLRHLELLPRPLGQDWSEIWLQNFSGTITIWPRSSASDFWYILSDPTPERLARMLQVGQSSTFPKLLFVANRMKIERLIKQGSLLQDSENGPPKSVHLPERPVISKLEQSVGRMENDGIANKVTRLGDLEGNMGRRSSSVMEELRRQGSVFFDDSDGGDVSDGSASEDDAVRVTGSSSTAIG